MNIEIAAAENKVTKVINRFGKKATYHNGGFRVGLVIDGQQFCCINKNATYAGEAESWGVLRAIEHAIATGVKECTISTVDHCTSPRRKGGFFIALATAKAEVAGLTWGLESAGKDDNDACDVARDQDARFLPRAAEETEEFKAQVGALMAARRSQNDEAARRRDAERKAPVEMSEPVTVEADHALVD